jgi:hypothetical protein
MFSVIYSVYMGLGGCWIIYVTPDQLGMCKMGLQIMWAC